MVVRAPAESHSRTFLVHTTNFRMLTNSFSRMALHRKPGGCRLPVCDSLVLLLVAPSPRQVSFAVLFIAPMLHTEFAGRIAPCTMTSSNEAVPSPYVASVNPPRRAKRARTDPLLAEQSTTPEITQTGVAQPRARPHILPKSPIDIQAMEEGYSDSGEGEEDDYDPGLNASAPKRRGRKPGAMSRSARESLRKLNHSRIEKARRTKINETLGTLSALVSEADARKRGPPSVAEPREDTTKGKRSGKSKSEDGKEFKLDVLVKAVSYMQELIEKVRQFETSACETCLPSTSTPLVADHREPSGKRKRVDEDMDDVSEEGTKDVRSAQDEDDSYIGDDEKYHSTTAFDEHQSPASAFSSRPSASPRLPPIASWLPHPYIDPSRLATISESQNPAPSSSSQLPSPPPSGRFRPAQSGLIMPPLTLPGPAHPFPHARFSPSVTRSDAPAPPPSASSSAMTSLLSRRHSVSVSDMQTRAVPLARGKAPSASPSVSPTWTPEDENAATLLLQMSSSPSSTASTSPSSVPPLSLSGSTPLERSPKAADLRSSPSSRAVPTAPVMTTAGQSEFVHMQAETPSSLLGLARD